MSLGALYPLEFYEIVWEGELLVLGMFDKTHLWSHMVQDLCLLGVFLITASISLVVISLFRFSNCSWFTSGRLYVSRYYLFHPGSPIWWHIIVCNIFLTILYISLASVVISPLSFLILFIWPLSLFFLMSLVKGLSIFFMFSRNQLLDSLIFCIVF